MVNPKFEGAVELIRSGRNVGAALFANAAAVSDGATTEWLSGRIGIVTALDRKIILDGSVWYESALGAQIVHDKHRTKKFLMEHGVDSPVSESATTPDRAVRIARRLGGAVILKPRGGSQGRGVSGAVQGDADVRSAYTAARDVKKRVLVERYIEIDEEYRCIATSSECLAVIKRVLPFVVGDGVSSIRELIVEKNAIRYSNPALWNLPIPIDVVLEKTLKDQGLSLDDILVMGRQVTVRNVGGLSGGGEPHECTNLASSEMKSLAVRAIAAIPGMRWGGVDVITEKGTGRPYVLEINAEAGFGAATFPMVGQPNDVAGKAWKLRLEVSAPDPTDEPPGLPSVDAPLSLAEAIPGTWDSCDSVSMADSVFAFASQSGFVVDYSSFPGVRISGPRILDRWFARNASGEKDLLAVMRIVRRHHAARKFLAHSEIPRTRGRQVKRLVQISDDLGSKSGRIIATPGNHEWGSSGSVKLNIRNAGELFHSFPSWFVQSSPNGLRVRVFARRDRALAAVVSEEDAESVSEVMIHAAVRAAVGGIRAVPELRWAAVDVLIEERSVLDTVRWRLSGKVEKYQALIEGMSVNPMLRGTDRLVGGELTEMFSWILQS